MYRWISFIALVVACATPVSAGNVAGCGEHRLCAETENFAFRIDESPLSIEVLQTRPDTDMSPLVNYIIQADRSRIFMAWLRPTPMMHSVAFTWRVGIKYGDEVIWSDKWFIPTYTGFILADPDNPKQFTPGVIQQSPTGNSFLMFLAFSDRTPSGQDWNPHKASGLVIE